ncbi:MAG: hypothetical protein ACTSVL_12150 [Promethearchaeota archaeon]
MPKLKLREKGINMPSNKKTTGKKSSRRTKKKSTSKKKKKTNTKKTNKNNTVQTKPVEREIVVAGVEEEEENKSDDNLSGIDMEKLDFIPKWWLQEPYRTLLDPELAKNVDLSKYDLSSLIQDFTDRMIKEDLIDFRITGLAIYSSAKLYHRKISGVIDEEEQIKKQEIRERLRREIPRAINQPLRESRKIATSEELFGAMRRAIIETMQKREKLRIRREKQVLKREKQIRVKNRGKLPAEILKHITGKSQTIEERLRSRHRQIQEIINMENSKDKTFSIYYIKNLIYNHPNKNDFEKKCEYINSFEELLFLSSLNKIHIKQEGSHTPILITLKDKTPIKF